MLIPSCLRALSCFIPSLSRRVNANSQLYSSEWNKYSKLIKKGEC